MAANHEPSHRLIRDIRWALQSPPLLTPAGDERFPSQAWFDSQADDVNDALIKLSTRHQEAEQLHQQWASLRLGGYFEQLLSWWLQHSSHYELLAHNLQVQGEGRTLGAFDLIVRNLQDNVVEHWELACKFYLQDGPSDNINSWFGPARKDKLFLKYQHLLNHQITLSESSHGRDTLAQRGWRVERHKIIVKGRLFGDGITLPKAVNPDCLRGWLHKEQQHENKPGQLPLQREHWMSAIAENDVTHPNLNAARRHGCVCLAELENGVEASRGFVIPNDWSQTG